MSTPHALKAALHALDKGPVADLSQLEALRYSLEEGERLLFDRAVELRRRFEELHTRVLSSATFAEASLGTAAFIHELRQHLSPLLGLTELMKETPDSPFTPGWVAEIGAQAGRMADLLDRHAALLRVRASEEAPCNLAELAAEARGYFTHLPPGVRLVVDLPPALPRALARRRPLLHALVNVLANARGAHRGRPGVIRLSARTHGDVVELLVSDQGSGVDPAVRPRLFEPLFTTKHEDGTGLGLFLSRELLRPRGDVVLLEGPEVPEGVSTAFALRLPAEVVRLETPVRAAPAPELTPGPVEAAGAEPNPWARARRRACERAALLVGGEHKSLVLVVEDEPAVRRMTRAVLEPLPHVRIYEAADAAFALGLLERLKVDFLVCDKNLPDQDGLEVIRRARQRYPWIGAMIVTGYPSPESATEAIRVGVTDYLLKPVREVRTLRDSVAFALAHQRLNGLCEQHEAVWREVAEELARHAPSGTAERAAVEELLRLLDPKLQSAGLVVAVVEEPEAQAALREAGLEVLGRDVDLVAFAAEEPPGLARTLVAAACLLACPPHLVALGRFVHTESAVATIQGRASVVLERSALSRDGQALLLEAGARRRREARAQALGRLLRHLGFEP